MCGNGEPSRFGMPEHDMAGPMLIVIDAQTVRDDLEVLNSPIASAHFGDEFPRVRNNYMVPLVIPPACWRTTSSQRYVGQSEVCEGRLREGVQKATTSAPKAL